MAQARGMDLIRFEGEEFHLIRPFLRKRRATLVVGETPAASPMSRAVSCARSRSLL